MLIKVKMLVRHHGNAGKMEKGLFYILPAGYAQELISHGLAEIVIDPVKEPEILIDFDPMPVKPISQRVKEIGKMRSRSGKFMAKNIKD